MTRPDDMKIGERIERRGFRVEHEYEYLIQDADEVHMNRNSSCYMLSSSPNV